MDFRKAFDTDPRVALLHKLQKLEVLELIWAIMTLYKTKIGQVRTLDGLSEPVHSTIGVTQGCPLSPTLFGLYVDEVSDYIERG